MRDLAPFAVPARHPASTTAAEFRCDLRFRSLVGNEGWSRLAPATRERFSKCVEAGETMVFAGLIEETRMSPIGRLLAQAARIVGAPLPLEPGAGLASVVAITENADGGQSWTRLYARSHGFPQIIHSSKRFTGPTGLEEYLGRGVGMTLRVAVEETVLVFRTAAYFVSFFGYRLAVPCWLGPGFLTVRHEDIGGDRFRFTLDLTHPLFGAMIRQSAVFRETQP